MDCNFNDMTICLKAPPFLNVFDATEVFRSDDQMVRIPAADVKPGDFVLLEAHISRFKIGDRQSLAIGDYVFWRAALDFSKVYIIQQGPGQFTDVSTAHAISF